MDESSLPEEFKPISMWGYVGYSLLFAIPCIGFIVVLVFAFGGAKNINLRNYARGQLLVIAIAVILWILIFAFSFSYTCYWTICCTCSTRYTFLSYFICHFHHHLLILFYLCDSSFEFLNYLFR